IPKLGSDSGMATKIAEIVAASRLIGSITVASAFVFQPLTAQALATGTDGTALTAADYEGNATQGTNLHAFDAEGSITKVCVPAIADGTLAKIVADYCDSRKDIMGLHRTPVGIQPNTVIEYRKGAGAY